MRLLILTSFLCFSALCLSIPLSQASSFALVVLSDDNPHNGTTLVPCQKGKGGPFPGLCPLAQLGYPLSDLETAFKLNHSSSSNMRAGYLTYELKNRQTSNGIANVTAPMALNNKGSYHVPTFGYASFDTATKVSFNERNYLGTPDGVNAKYDKWYICDIDGGLTYPSIVWSSGSATPQLSSCVKVIIMRV